MRRSEEKFASPSVCAVAAEKLAPAIRQARLSRNMTQSAAAERAKMSALTWMKIEKGNVAVSLGAWLSALECVGLLDALTLGAGVQAGAAAALVGAVRLRARANATLTDAYDF